MTVNAGLSRRYLTRLLCSILVMGLTACSGSETEPSKSPSHTSSLDPSADLLPPITETAAQTHIASLALKPLLDRIDAYYLTLDNDARALNSTIMKLAKTPSDTIHENSLKAWEQAHDAYHAGLFLHSVFTELLSMGSTNANRSIIDAHTRLDSHPLLPGYLDSVKNYPFSGLIHADINITLENLYQEFQLGDKAYVTLGFHPLEIMLRGADKEREITDFAALNATKKSQEESPEIRRTLYSALLARQIHTDIRQISLDWKQRIQPALAAIDTQRSNTLIPRLTKILDQHLKRLETAQVSDETLGITPHQSARATEMARVLLSELLEALKPEEK